MGGALAELNDELERRSGVRLATRTGVNTGEVVAGDPTRGQAFVVGDAVNVAARLEQAAGAGRGADRGDPPSGAGRGPGGAVEPLALKGKRRPSPPSGCSR